MIDDPRRAPRPRVLIIGGGFGGLYAARGLRRAAADVTVLDRGTSNLFQPLLYQCATGLLSEGQITSPLREMLRRHRNTRVLLGEASTMDAAAKTVTAARPDGTTFELGYDYLVIAAGMRQSYFGHDEFAAFAPGMKTLDDALAIRRRIYGAFEVAETLPTAAERQQWLTFAVTGGGATGVELAGQIRELATRTLAREFHTIDPAEARVLLFDGGSAPLASFGPELSGRAARTLTKIGVELHMNVRVTDVDAAGLVATAKDGTETRFPSRTVLWTAGVEAVPFLHAAAAALGVDPDRSGRLAVNPDLTVSTHDNVWAVGDVMALDKLPGVAEVAMQGGHHVATEIRRRAAGKPHRSAPFHYRDLGSAAYVARYHAVVEVGPLKAAGIVGWLLWGLIHLAFLAGVRNRAGALLTWLLTIGRGTRRERAVPYRDPVDAPYPYPAARRDADGK